MNSPLHGCTAPTARRRLDQLPAQAQELLVAATWQPAALRKLLEQALGRVHGNPVRLQGSDADVLASLRLDLAQRNPVSELLHRQMALRHQLASQRLAALRDSVSLQAAWLQRPSHESAVACLWALLTHRQGAELQDWALRAYKQHLYALAAQALSTQATEAALQARVQELQTQSDQLRQRLLHLQADAVQQVRALHAEVARLRGAAAAAQAQPATRDGMGPIAPTRPSKALLVTERAAPPKPEPTPELAAPGPMKKINGAEPAAPDTCLLAAPAALQGQRVLCVGGIQHAVARYRSRIEKLGGRFEYHDGGLHDNAHALAGRLARADLVICQAGCINHAAYHRIKQHCQKSGKPCMYLERASLSRFDLALQQLSSSPQTARPA